MDADEEADLVLAQTAVLLDRQGDREASQLLADVSYLDFEHTGDSYRTSEVSWVGSTAAVLYVEDYLVPAFTQEIQERIRVVLLDVALRNGYTATDRMFVKQVLPDVDKGWRDDMRARALERPTNQARRERLTPNHPVVDGLALGSRQEHQVYLALKEIQATTPPDRTIAIAPLPGVRLQAGHTWTPDLIVLGNGRAVVFEGTGLITETAADTLMTGTVIFSGSVAGSRSSASLWRICSRESSLEIGSRKSSHGTSGLGD